MDTLPSLLTTLTTLLTPTSLPPGSDTLIAASSLVASGKSEAIGPLFDHAVKDITSIEEKDRLSKRLRDVLMKEWTLIGIPLVITGLASLAKAEGGHGILDGEQISGKW